MKAAVLCVLALCVAVAIASPFKKIEVTKEGPAALSQEMVNLINSAQSQWKAGHNKHFEVRLCFLCVGLASFVSLVG